MSCCVDIKTFGLEVREGSETGVSTGASSETQLWGLWFTAVRSRPSVGRSTRPLCVRHFFANALLARPSGRKAQFIRPTDFPAC